MTLKTVSLNGNILPNVVTGCRAASLISPCHPKINKNPCKCWTSCMQLIQNKVKSITKPDIAKNKLLLITVTI